jgi:radical SAM family uncharacterized protein/radical SAM-linked protein
MSKNNKIDCILPLVRKPGRYIGGELNVVQKKPEPANLSFALVFPDLYEIGMSHQGLQILYHIINRRDNLVAERCYVPDVDMEKQLRDHEISLFSLESRTPLAEFDIIGFTLPYELCYTNILTVLDLSGIPLQAMERSEEDPLVIAGGSCSMNPEPVADFFDAVVLGDGEEIVLEIADVLQAAGSENCTRMEKLHRLARVPGVYIPRFFEAEYDHAQLKAVRPLVEGYTKVVRRILPQLPPVELLTRPLVPLVKPVHDRLGIEIARGCTRGCRFCQAGMIYRPVRERSVEDIMELAEQGIKNSGFDELALLSLSSGDFSCLPQLLIRLMDRFADEYVSVSMPSMRVGTLTPEVIEQIKRVRKTGFTVAPEAGTDRMREVINKGITEQDLLATCRDAFGAGWNLIKFYFMIGLPTETMDDVDGIVDLAIRSRKEARGARAQINVSVATFVPKPHTPFQWSRQLNLKESRERIDHLKKTLPRKGFKLKWHDPQQSLLEGVFSRGDRRLGALIETAWRSGARLDGWSEHFSLARWQQAAQEIGLDLDWYLRERSREEVLPWDHLHCGVDRSFLEQEFDRALHCSYTPDCRNNSCRKCGLCDFKTIKPRVNATCDLPPVQARKKTAGDRPADNDHQPVFSYRVKYKRLGDARFLGHLEMLQLIFRALHRSGLPVLFSRGYNPSPRVSFSQALPVGVESHAEHFDVDLAEPVTRFAETAALLDSCLPVFVSVTEVVPVRKSKKGPMDTVVGYTVYPADQVNTKAVQEIVEKFSAADAWVIERIRKKKKRELDLKPLVLRLSVDDSRLEMVLRHPHSAAGTNPREILVKVLGLDEKRALQARIVKNSVQEIAANS